MFPELGRLLRRRAQRRQEVAGEVAASEPAATVAVEAWDAWRPRARAKGRTCHFHSCAGEFCRGAPRHHGVFILERDEAPRASPNCFTVDHLMSLPFKLTDHHSSNILLLDRKA